ncbi:unnamed protein product [Protopolystoma xenopodis]|uniref:Uncharacterized protein n=1 Tax=Protopolystoma xenopodis TaxID=117903 RepID=A0A3S5B9F8_9PLAT|nr:unnamed protein product [Protopolystoma xenopodis]
MVSNSGPPLPMPMRVPVGHLVQQIIDDEGILTHVILSPFPPVQSSPCPPSSTSSATTVANSISTSSTSAPAVPLSTGADTNSADLSLAQSYKQQQINESSHYYQALPQVHQPHSVYPAVSSSTQPPSTSTQPTSARQHHPPVLSMHHQHHSAQTQQQQQLLLLKQQSQQPHLTHTYSPSYSHTQPLSQNAHSHANSHSHLHHSHYLRPPSHPHIISHSRPSAPARLHSSRGPCHVDGVSAPSGRVSNAQQPAPARGQTSSPSPPAPRSVQSSCQSMAGPRALLRRPVGSNVPIVQEKSIPVHGKRTEPPMFDQEERGKAF